jgi:hypothetical protein
MFCEGTGRVRRLSGGRERSLDYDEAQSFQDPFSVALCD